MTTHAAVQKGQLVALCECGCGVEAEAQFLPGHDQRLRAELERRVGGILAMRVLVDAMEAYARGNASSEELGKAVRRTFSSVKKAG